MATPTFLVRLGTAVRSIPRRLSDERGSAALLMPVGALLFATSMALVVDVGLLVNDRRDLQATADAMALAGALELTLRASDDTAVRINAEDRAADWGAANGLDLTDPDLDWDVEVVRNCHTANDGMYTGVRVTIDRTPMIALLDYFGATWRSGASALACAGRPLDESGFLPLAVSETGACFTGAGGGHYEAKVGERCDIQMSSTAGGLNGTLGFDPDGDCDDGNPSADELRDIVAGGVHYNCAMGDSVQGGPGHSVGAIRQGLQNRLTSGHPCDLNSPVSEAELDASTASFATQGFPPLVTANKNNGRDDLFEVWERNTSTSNSADNLLPYDCHADTGVQTSPRNVSIIVVHDWSVPDGSAGPKSYIVRGFVRVFIEGCTPATGGHAGEFFADCDAAMGGGPFAIHVRLVEQLGEFGSTLGHSDFGDIGIFLKE